MLRISCLKVVTFYQFYTPEGRGWLSNFLSQSQLNFFISFYRIAKSMHSIFAFYGRSAESRWYFIHEVQKCISVVHFYSTRKVLDDFFTPPTNFNHKTAPFSKVFRVVKIQLVIGSQVFLQIKNAFLDIKGSAHNL